MVVPYRLERVSSAHWIDVGTDLAPDTTFQKKKGKKGIISILFSLHGGEN